MFGKFFKMMHNFFFSFMLFILVFDASFPRLKVSTELGLLERKSIKVRKRWFELHYTSFHRVS